MKASLANRVLRHGAAFLSLVTAIHSAGAAYRFVTYAGESSVGATDGSTAAARFIAPSAVAVDRQGNVYVADTGNHTVRKISPQGQVTTVAGAAGRRGSTNGVGAEARFNSPTGIAVDPNGNLVVADFGNHLVRQITPDGRVSTLAGGPGESGDVDGGAAVARFNGPRGVAVDAVGNVYVCEMTRVRGISPTGTVRTIATLTGRTVALTLDPAGRIYVAEEGRNSIVRILADGRVETLGGATPAPGSAWDKTNFISPTGVASSADGTLYVADASYTIHKVSADGAVTLLAGKSNSRGFAEGVGIQARFSDPAGLAVDLAGNVYVAERGNNIIRRINPSAEVITLAGFALGTSPRDGTSQDARFASPRGLAVDSDGSLYLADDTSLRRISAAGSVTTVARTPDVLAGNVNHPLSNMSRVAVTTTGEILVLGGIYQRSIGRISPAGEFAYDSGVVGSGTWLGDICLGKGDRLYAAVNFGYAQAWVCDPRLGYPAAIVVSSQLPDVTPLSFSFDAITSDHAGNLYLAYRGNRGSPPGTERSSTTIRKLSPEGTLTLMAGKSGAADLAADGVGAAAGIGLVTGMTLDAKGNLLVVDHDNHTIRQVAPDGTVTTIGGTAGAAGHADGIGADARFYYPEDIAIAANGDLFITSGTTIRRGIKIEAPLIERQPASAAVSGGASFTLSVSALGEPNLAYQWSRNGTPIAGATAASYIVQPATAADAGTYTVTVTNSFGAATSDSASVTVNTPAPPPSPPASSSGGGGGAVSLWFFPAVTAAALTRALQRRCRDERAKK